MIALTKRRLVGALALGALGAAGSCLRINPFPDVVIALGEVALIYASLTLGPVLAMLVAFLSLLPTLFLWEQPFGLTLGVLEAVVFGYLYVHRRMGAIRSFLWFWSLLGLPLVYWMIFHFADRPEPARWVLLVKYPLNSVLALMVANVLLRFRVLTTLTGGVVPEEPQRLGRLLFSTYAPVVLAPLLIFAVSVGTLATQRYLSVQQASLQRESDEIAGDMGETLAFLQRSVADAAADLEALGQEQAPAVLERFHRTVPHVSTMLAADAAGRVYCSVSLAQGQRIVRSGEGISNVADREYFKVPMASRRVFVSNGFKGRVFGPDLIFAIAAPILNRNGVPTGIVEASVLLRDAVSGVQPLVRRWPSQKSAVVDGNGRVILSSPGAGLRPLENLQLRYGLTRHAEGNTAPAFFEEVRRPGAPPEVVLRSIAAVTGQSWRVVVDLPLREDLMIMTEGYLVAMFWAGVAWLIAIGVTRVASEQITSPFKYLATLARTAHPADLAERQKARPPAMPAELVELERVLADSYRELGRANEELRAALQGRDEANRTLRALSEELERKVAARTVDLEDAKHRAEQASRAKSEFVAHLSHELRTPLNVMLGSVQLLERDRGAQLSQAEATRLRQITASGALLRDLIESVLDMAKIESGTVELTPVNLDAAALVRECAAMLEAAAMRKAIRLTVSIQVEDGRMVADRRRLQQILVNLLNNAIKFTPSGCAVEIALMPAPDVPAGIAFVVADTGRGIPREEQAQLFDPFVRGSAAKASGEPGTGLGLPLVKRLVEHHHGTLQLWSEEGKGSRFTVTLPRFALTPEPAAPPAPEFAPAATSATSATSAAAPSATARPASLVLIAEDHEPNAIILAEFCELEGLKTRIAGHIQESIRRTI